MILRVIPVLVAGLLAACSTTPDSNGWTFEDEQFPSDNEGPFLRINYSSRRIINNWALDQKLPVGPLWLSRKLHSFRVQPWSNNPETLYEVEEGLVRIRAMTTSLWDQMNQIMAAATTLTEQEILDAITVTETLVNAEECPIVVDAPRLLNAAYSAPDPGSLSVYADGPTYIAAMNGFGGDAQIRNAHSEHRVIAAWLSLIEELEKCGIPAVWKDSG